MEKPDFSKLRAEGTDELVVPALVINGNDWMRGLPWAIRMFGFMNEQAYNKTLDTGLVTFWSRSRQKLWTKGETSGNTMRVLDIWSDCDNDSLLIMADCKGATCHTGDMSCFKGLETSDWNSWGSETQTGTRRDALSRRMFLISKGIDVGNLSL